MREDIEQPYQNISNINSTKIFFNSDILINPESHIVYKRIEIEKDGDCGYKACKITRKEAYVLLVTNIPTITPILQPVIQEALITERFIKYMKFHKCASSLQEAFKNYQYNARKSKNIDRVLEILKEHALQLDVVLNYLNYDVRDKMVDDGWAHPCVLQALAHLQSKELYIWQQGVDKTLVPHPGYPYYKSINSIQRVDLLFVNGNHFERLEMINHFFIGELVNDSRKRKNKNKVKKENKLSINYVHRKSLMIKIEYELNNKNMVILSGLGGSGKTQLAIGYAYNHAKEYCFMGWIDANSENEYEQYYKLALQLNMEKEVNEKYLNLDDLIQRIKKKLSGQNFPWLIIYDDFYSSSQLKLYDKSGLNLYANFLCTTRKKNIEGLSYSITVDSYQLEEGLSFIFGAMRNSDEFSKNTAMIMPLNSVFSNDYSVNAVDEVSSKHFEKNDGYMGAEVLEVANNKKNIKEIFCKDNSFMKNSKILFDKLQGFPVALDAAVKFMRKNEITIQRFIEDYQFTIDNENYFEVDNVNNNKDINIFTYSGYDINDFIYPENFFKKGSFELLLKCAYLNHDCFLKKHLKYIFSVNINEIANKINLCDNEIKLYNYNKKEFNECFEELINNSIFNVTRFEFGDFYSINRSLQYMLRKYLFKENFNGSKKIFDLDNLHLTIYALYEFTINVVKNLFYKRIIHNVMDEKKL